MTKKLFKLPRKDLVSLAPDLGQIIDRNFMPFKMNIKLSSEGDRIKTAWKNEDFEELCNTLKQINQPRITDVIFCMYDWSGESRDNIVSYIKKVKQLTKNDQKTHNFSLLPEGDSEHFAGLTYLSDNTNDIKSLDQKLFRICYLRKYKEKANVWLGLGGLNGSNNLIDIVMFNDDPWKPDEVAEEGSKDLGGTLLKIGEKVGRNDPCPCGSGRKYKKCCL
jgi:preprotein translocase subunit SecA